MNQLPFEPPMDDFLSGKFNFKNSLPSNLFGRDFDALDLEADLDSEEFRQTESALFFSLQMLQQSDKARVFLDSFKIPPAPRLRKDVFRELARVTNRTEKEIQALPETEKARLYGRNSHKMEPRIAGLVLAGALTNGYFQAVSRLLEKVAAAPAQAKQLFEDCQDQMPLRMWNFVLPMAERDTNRPAEQRNASRTLQEVIPQWERAPLLPFAVGGEPQLNALEQHLLELHTQDPAKARPLVAALAQINPDRPENWLLFGLTGCTEPHPRSEAQHAWHLASQLYRWGENLQTADLPFDAQTLKKNTEAIRLLFASPAFASARELVGEYLIRQLAEAKELTLLLEVLPQDLFRKYQPLLSAVIDLEARELAKGKKVAQVRCLLERFPFLKTTSVLPLALRRNGEFEAALAELRAAGPDGKAERALIEARLTNAMDLELPETAEQQRQLIQRIEPLQECFEDTHPEIRYCDVLYALLINDREEAELAFEDLEVLPLNPPKRKAYQLLLALRAQDSRLIDQVLTDLEGSLAEEMLAFIPNNLLKTSIRALALASNPQIVKGLADLLYLHLPEALDPLLGNVELLAVAPALIQRLMDKNEQLTDPIQRWACYQQVIDLPSARSNPDLVARAIDGCLGMKDPLLASHQIRLLRERIPQSEDLDLRELLVERLGELSAEEAKPYLYQLLHTYLGNQRPFDAYRIVQALRDLGEVSADLDHCSRVVQQSIPGGSAAKNDRLARPVSVGFYGGDTSQKSRTDQLRTELMRKHPGLTVEFDHTVWNPNNLANLVQSVAKFDVVVATNLMRTDISRGIRQRARELNKTWGYCRNQGLATITNSILNAVNLHLARKI